MDALEVVRTLEGFKIDAKHEKKFDLVAEIDSCIEILAESNDLKYCDGCSCHKEKEDFDREDYCRVCRVAAAHQRASDEEDYNYVTGRK